MTFDGEFFGRVDITHKLAITTIYLQGLSWRSFQDGYAVLPQI